MISDSINSEPQNSEAFDNLGTLAEWADQTQTGVPYMLKTDYWQHSSPEVRRASIGELSKVVEGDFIAAKARKEDNKGIWAEEVDLGDRKETVVKMRRPAFVYNRVDADGSNVPVEDGFLDFEEVIVSRNGKLTKEGADELARFEGTMFRLADNNEVRNTGYGWEYGQDALYSNIVDRKAPEESIDPVSKFFSDSQLTMDFGATTKELDASNVLDENMEERRRLGAIVKNNQIGPNDWRRSRLGDDPASKLDPKSEAGFEEFKKKMMSMTTGGPELLSEDEIARWHTTKDENGVERKTNAQFNPSNLFDIKKVEAWIDGNNHTPAEKAYLRNLHSEMVNNALPEIIKSVTAAEHTRELSHLNPLAPIESLARNKGNIGKVWDEWYGDKAYEVINEGLDNGKKPIDIVRENPDLFSKDRFSLSEEVLGKTGIILAQTGASAAAYGGAGLKWIANKAIDATGGTRIGDNAILDSGFKALQYFGDYSEASKGAFRDPVIADFGYFTVNRNDATELTAQVGSFYVMGGVGRAIGSGLSAGARLALKANKALTPWQKVALVMTKSGREAKFLNGLKTQEEKVAAAVSSRHMSNPQRLAKFGKEMVMDETAYLGGLQAAGMSYGSEYTQRIEAGMSPDEAHQKAFAAGIGTGLSALVATSFFNRFGMGLEGAFGQQGRSTIAAIQSTLKTAPARKAFQDAAGCCQGVCQRRRKSWAAERICQGFDWLDG